MRHVAAALPGSPAAAGRATTPTRTRTRRSRRATGCGRRGTAATAAQAIDLSPRPARQHAQPRQHRAGPGRALGLARHDPRARPGWRRLSAYYSYGIDKQRTRKRTRARNGGSTEDRIYLGGYELYRRRDPQGAVVEEIESLHLFEGEQRVLLVDDVIVASRRQPGPTVSRPEQTLFRYQYGNHLGSVSARAGRQPRTSFPTRNTTPTARARTAAGIGARGAAKRYRYTGMERDEESGLTITGRGIMAWLAGGRAPTRPGW